MGGVLRRKGVAAGKTAIIACDMSWIEDIENKYDKDRRSDPSRFNDPPESEEDKPHGEEDTWRGKGKGAKDAKGGGKSKSPWYPASHNHLSVAERVCLRVNTLNACWRVWVAL